MLRVCANGGLDWLLGWQRSGASKTAIGLNKEGTPRTGTLQQQQRRALLSNTCSSVGLDIHHISQLEHALRCAA
jgi:hypothetical protein